MTSTSATPQSMSPLCEYHRKGELEFPDLSYSDDACVACRIAYLEAQESLLEEWQKRAIKAEDDIKDMQRPLDAQMARLNAEVVRLNGLLAMRSETTPRNLYGIKLPVRVEKHAASTNYRNGRLVAPAADTELYREHLRALHDAHVQAYHHALTDPNRCPNCGAVWTEFMRWYDGEHCGISLNQRSKRSKRNQRQNVQSTQEDATVIVAALNSYSDIPEGRRSPPAGALESGSPIHVARDATPGGAAPGGACDMRTEKGSGG